MITETDQSTFFFVIGAVIIVSSMFVYSFLNQVSTVVGVTNLAIPY